MCNFYKPRGVLGGVPTGDEGGDCGDGEPVPGMVPLEEVK